MLKLNPSPKFKAVMKITVPGWVDQGEITLMFKYRSKSGYNEWIGTWDEKRDPDTNKTIQEKKDDAQIFMEYVEGWEGIEAEFNKENVTIFLNNYPVSSYEIFTEYSRLLFESRVKN